MPDPLPQDSVLFEVIKQVLVVTFNRPQNGNALTFDMLTKIHNRLKLVTTDKAIRAILICGAGEDFMAGYDEQMMRKDHDSWVQTLTQMTPVQHLILRDLQTMEKPIIAHVNGRVSGPGLSFAFCADLILASDNTIFSAGMNHLALPPQGAATYFITHRIGTARALEFFLFDREIDATTAENWGLINKVLPHEGTREEALRLTESVARGPTRAFATTRQLIRKTLEHDFHAHLGEEHAAWGACSRTFDSREALKAIIQKRPPAFTGA